MSEKLEQIHDSMPRKEHIGEEDAPKIEEFWVLEMAKSRDDIKQVSSWDATKISFMFLAYF